MCFRMNNSVDHHMKIITLLEKGFVRYLSLQKVLKEVRGSAISATKIMKVILSWRYHDDWFIVSDLPIAWWPIIWSGVIADSAWFVAVSFFHLVRANDGGVVLGLIVAGYG